MFSQAISMPLALICALSTITFVGASDPSLLERICTGDDTASLTRSSQVTAIAGELSEAKSCGPAASEAVLALEKLISASKDASSLERALQFKDLYDKYLGENSSKDAGELPSALRHFILAYGFQLSRMNKKIMINSLQLDGDSMLDKSDFEYIDMWTNDASPIAQLLGKPDAHDDLILPGDLSLLRHDNMVQPVKQEASGNGDKEEAPHANEQMHVGTLTVVAMRHLQAACKLRFRPIYEQLILPVVYLSNLGFSIHADPQLERELSELRLNKMIHRWYRIVYLCESLDSVEVFDLPDEDLLGVEEPLAIASNLQQREVRILSSEEAAKMREKQHEGESYGFEQVNYAVDTHDARLQDEVLDQSDNDLMRVVARFDVHMSKVERIKERLLKKTIKLLKGKLTSGQFVFTMGSLFKDTYARFRGHSTCVNRRMVDAMDDYMKNGGRPISMGDMFAHHFPTIFASSWLIFGLIGLVLGTVVTLAG